MKYQAVVVAAALGALVGCLTMSSEDELPEVLSPLPWDTCPAVRVGRAVSSGQTYFFDGSGLIECARSELDACHKGGVAYRLQLDRQGALVGLDFQEPHATAVEACVAKRLHEALFTPALDCAFTPVPSEFQGDVTWNPEVGISFAVPGVSAIAPALPRCALPVSEGKHDIG